MTNTCLAAHHDDLTVAAVDRHVEIRAVTCGIDRTTVLQPRQAFPQLAWLEPQTLDTSS